MAINIVDLLHNQKQTRGPGSQWPRSATPALALVISLDAFPARPTRRHSPRLPPPAATSHRPLPPTLTRAHLAYRSSSPCSVARTAAI